MEIIKIPNILTDLAHVGTGGIPTGPSPAVLEELEVCRQWGYRLEQKNKRICLLFDHDQIVPYWIQRETPDLAWGGLRVNGFLRLDSTNREALDQARIGAPGGTLVCAEEQIAGRGRSGRKWFSPAGSGLYFSLIVRPTQALETWPLLTHAASVSLVYSLQELVETRIIPHSMEIDIKWPNDVLISGKKCAGILLETTDEGPSRAVVLGVGINVREASVPAGMSETAICLDGAAGCILPRRKILVCFLKHFQTAYTAYEAGAHEELLQSWKEHSSMWNGSRIWIEEGDGWRAVETCGLDKIGALLVRNDDGTTETLHAGDIRIQRTAAKE